MDTIRETHDSEPAEVYLVGEAGSNHDGDLAAALDLIDVAARAGCDAVKFQTFRADRLYPKNAGACDYLNRKESIYDIIEALEMPDQWLPSLRARAREHGLDLLSSPFHEEAVELLDPHVDAFKIASYELTHEPLLREVAGRGKRVLLSTGAANLDEVRQAVDTLRSHGCDDLVVLQCTASYPTPPRAANVRALVTLREALEVPTGLSDHTRDPVAVPAAATALGAVVIEKHFTLSNDRPGPDHQFAVEPDELTLMVDTVRTVELALGTGAKEVHAVEDELRAFARRSVFTLKPVRAGEAFTRDNVDVLRNGQHAPGLPPGALEVVLRSVATRDIPGESVLRHEDLFGFP